MLVNIYHRRLRRLTTCYTEVVRLGTEVVAAAAALVVGYRSISVAGLMASYSKISAAG
jgi:hypothetical protein